MKSNYRRFLAGATLLIVPLACAVYSQSDRDRNDRREGPETEYRWDLVHIIFSNPSFSVFPGGSDSALANDGSKITLTGQGTFEPREPSEVTGGGTWMTFDAGGGVGMTAVGTRPGPKDAVSLSRSSMGAIQPCSDGQRHLSGNRVHSLHCSPRCGKRAGHR